MTAPPDPRDFYIATADEIRAGKTTDVYFLRTLDVLKKAGKADTPVDAEITTGALPNGWPWAILSGVEEVVHLLDGKGASLWSARGDALRAEDPAGSPAARDDDLRAVRRLGPL